MLVQVPAHWYLRVFGRFDDCLVAHSHRLGLLNHNSIATTCFVEVIRPIDLEEWALGGRLLPSFLEGSRLRYLLALTLQTSLGLAELHYISWRSWLLLLLLIVYGLLL